MTKEEREILLAYPLVIKDQGAIQDAIEQAIRDSEKLSKIEQIINATEYVENGAIYSYCYNQERKVDEIREVIEDESID